MKFLDNADQTGIFYISPLDGFGFFPVRSVIAMALENGVNYN